MALNQVLYHWQTLFDQINNVSDNHKYYNCLRYDKKQIRQIEYYASIQQPYEKLDLKQKLQISEELEDWKTPNQALMYKICLYYLTFKYHLKYFQKEDKKYWILKPLDKSKGCGIQIINNNKQIQQITKKKDRIVQQYITNPLLYNNKIKFDLRIWVLISSVEPLEIYYYRDYYVRLCSKEYDLNDISNLNRHLTNYSINKNKFENSQNSILSKTTFENWLKQNFLITFQDKIKPQIQNIIYTSIKSCQKKIKHRNKSFELLGYDFLIDNNFKVWLLEINLSPACKNRSEYLNRMLEEMTTSLFNIVQKKPQNQNINKWENIRTEKKEKKEKTIIKKIDFKLQGQSLDIKIEKKNMKNLRKNLSAFKIQQQFRQQRQTKI